MSWDSYGTLSSPVGNLKNLKKIRKYFQNYFFEKGFFFSKKKKKNKREN
jgi:hypothetical protein